MRFLLDTNAVIGLLRLDRAVVRAANRHRLEDVGSSIIVLHELYYGAFKSARLADNLKTIANLGIEFLEVEHGDARTAAEIRNVLKVQGTPIGAYDVLVAGQALSRDLTLITRNVREFSPVEELRVENWEA